MNILERIERHAQCLQDDQCWFTDYKPNSQGYKPIRLDDGSQSALHRVAWEAYNCEPIPEGMHVMHSCDNPMCFNPEHLSLGTNEDNIADKCRKGRQRGISRSRAIARAHHRVRNELGQWV